MQEISGIARLQLRRGAQLFTRSGKKQRERMLIFTHDGDPGVDLRVPGFDGVEAGFGEIDGGDLLRADAGGGLFESERAEFGGSVREGGYSVV